MQIPSRFSLALRGKPQLWTAGTGVHLAATGYVYSVVWQLVWLIPVLWAGAWTLQHRLGDFTLNPSRPMQALTLALPLLLTLLAADQPHITLFWQLNLLNASLYGLIWGRRPENRAAWELGILAAALVVAGGLVDPVWSPLASWRGHDVLVPGWLVYTVARGFLSRQPAWSLAASVALTVGLLAASSAGTMAVHPALHYGLVVFMLHSLFWSRTISLEANWGRRAVALVWVLHSLGWMNENGLPAIQFVLGTSGLLLAVCGAVKWLNGIPFPWFLLVSAASVWLAGCVGWLRQNQAEHLPGMGALVLSLVLFAAGTLLALSREKWGLTWPRSKANEP